ncbi:HpcH/HpaI aldolase/citrate lyase family protein [Paenibacillus thalictri]|uniref:CoA ester lyase n=1 Tax=Paenibacillus thalictri TaxID=2527873 RepID=A0A4Q9DNG3_9BACL|nr:CoA ester lyase [Paenibacillus thalictri]TBL75993.1 CoA ester lyase [Paenibacillus thalictri]
MSLFRSWIFVPGNQRRRLAKVPELQADVIIYDLEDSVPPQEKAAARAAVAEALQNTPQRLQYVRVNDADSIWFMDDVAELTMPGLHGFMLPKAAKAEHIQYAHRVLSKWELQKGLQPGAIDLVPLIESAEGLYRAYEIASCCGRVRRLAFGSVDYTLDINGELTDDGLELLYARSQLVVQSRAAGIEAPIDGVYTHIKDLPGLERDTRLAKQLGFQGKLAVHPAQTETIDGIFAPTRQAIEEAEAVVAAFRKAESAGIAAIMWNGKMIDYPVVQRHMHVLETARRLGLIMGADAGMHASTD